MNRLPACQSNIEFGRGDQELGWNNDVGGKNVYVKEALLSKSTSGRI